MADAVVRISDAVTPEVFNPYTAQQTEVKSKLLSSGVVVRSPLADRFLSGGGLTFNLPSWQDIPDDDANVSSDDPTAHSETKKISSSQEIAVRLNRNQSWSDMDLTGELAGSDPLRAIGDRVSSYWTRQAQAAFVATMKGIFADNDAAPAASEHVAGDLTHDISTGPYVQNETDFTAKAFIFASHTMGDSADDLGVCFMHSYIYSRAKINNLIDFVPDAVNPDAADVPAFLGHRVVVDDAVPNPSSGVYETWLFGQGAVLWGVTDAETPSETLRVPTAGAGGGQTKLFSRVSWTFHPKGHKFAVASPASGGPSNAATSGNLAHAASWQRVFPERKQIKIARLITKEF